MTKETVQPILIDQLIELFKHNLGERGEVRKILNESLTLGEIRSICFDLHIEFEDLDGERIADKIRELLLYCLRREKLGDLFAHIFKFHPYIESKLIRIDVLSTAGHNLAKDEYAWNTLKRFLSQPEDDHRTHALLGVVNEAIQEDTVLRKIILELAESKYTHGDTINQEIQIEKASVQDIFQIGKVVNIDEERYQKKKRKKWLFF